MYKGKMNFRCILSILLTALLSACSVNNIERHALLLEGDTKVPLEVAGDLVYKLRVEFEKNGCPQVGSLNRKTVSMSEDFRTSGHQVLSGQAKQEWNVYACYRRYYYEALYRPVSEGGSIYTLTKEGSWR